LQPIRLKLGQLSSRSYHGRFDVGGKLYDITHEVVSELMDECHEIVSKYLTKSDYYRVAKPLRPIHDKLQHIVYALQHMENQKDLQPRELLPYRRALGDLDGIYHDAAFDVSDDPTDNFPNYPQGQAIVTDLFNEAYRLVQMLKMKTDFYRFDEKLLPLFDSLQTVIAALEGHTHRSTYTPSPWAKKKKFKFSGLQNKTHKLFNTFKNLLMDMNIDSIESIRLCTEAFEKIYNLLLEYESLHESSSGLSSSTMHHQQQIPA